MRHEYTNEEVELLFTWENDREKFIVDNNLNKFYGPVLHYVFFNRYVNVGIVGPSITAANQYLQCMRPQITNIVEWKRPQMTKVNSHDIAFSNSSGINALGPNWSWFKGRTFNAIFILPTMHQFIFREDAEVFYDEILPFMYAVNSNLIVEELN